MITAPLVMPEIITGLSLLFLFISMANLIGWPMNRGATTITIAHITFSMAYVVVVVRSRLAAMDDTLEEAAMDLGGRPVAVFFDVTVPMLLPALVSGWLLSFTLSLDDLVISSFVSGPGATTLPMLIFAKVRLGVTPDINAITTIIIVLVASPSRPRRSCRTGAGRLRRTSDPGGIAVGECLKKLFEGYQAGYALPGAVYHGPRDLRARAPAHLPEVLALRRAPEPGSGAGRLFPVRDRGRVRHPRARRARAA